MVIGSVYSTWNIPGDRVPRTNLTPLALTALAFLAERPMHPYEMYQLAQRRKDDRLVKLRPGTLYHAVSRMEADGLVKALRTEREGNRPERTSYEITAAGRAVLQSDISELLGGFTLEYPVFPFALSEAHILTADEVVAQLGRRLAAVTELVDELSASIDRLATSDVPWAYWLHAEYLQTLYRAEAAWLEHTIVAVADGALDLPERSPASEKEST